MKMKRSRTCRKCSTLPTRPSSDFGAAGDASPVEGGVANLGFTESLIQLLFAGFRRLRRLVVRHFPTVDDLIVALVHDPQRIDAEHDVLHGFFLGWIGEIQPHLKTSSPFDGQLAEDFVALQ